MILDLGRLVPAAFEAWTVVFELDTTFDGDWVVVGGQMVALHAASLGVRDGIRPTDDVDVIVDVLAPEGLGARASLTTSPPARTVQGPGGTQALRRTERVAVAMADMTGARTATGWAHRPDLLGALVAKAAATTIAVRDNPIRDWQDAAMLLAHVPDPYSLAEQTSPKDRQRLTRQRLTRLAPLQDRRRRGWDRLSDDDHRRGITALDILRDSL